MTIQIRDKSILDGVVKQKIAAVYARVSTDEQGESGTSLDMQARVGLAYAEGVGLFVPPEFVFREDYSGKTLNRPELNKLRSLLRTGQVQAVIVYKADRLDRSEWGANLIHLAAELKSLDAELHYSEDRKKIDLQDPFDVFMHAHFKGFFAGEDHRATVVKLLKGRREKVRDYNSVMVAAKPPYGYDVVQTPIPDEPKKHRYEFVINEREAAVVRDIYQWYLFGDVDKDGDAVPLGFGAIATKLTKLKIPTRGDESRKYTKKFEGRWAATVVRRILVNETYAGLWRFGKQHERTAVVEKEIIEVEVPAIIPVELWQLAQERRKIKRHSNSRKHFYLLSGRVTCGHCGLKMIGESKRGGTYRYYRCPTKKNLSHRPCDNLGYSVDKVDTALWNWLTEIFTDETGEALRNGLIGYRAQNSEKCEGLEQDLKIAEKTIRDIDERLESLYSDYQRAGGDWLKKRIEGDMQLLEMQQKSQQAKADELRQALRDKTVTPQEEISLLEFAAEIREQWAIVSKDPDSRQAVLDRFNIVATLKVVDGKRHAVVTGKIVPDEKVLPVENLSTCL